MAITIYPLNCGKLHILDLDADEYGNFIVLMSNLEVWTNYWKLPLPKQNWYCLIRQLDADRFLVIDSQQTATGNGYIFDSAGQLIARFNAGDTRPERRQVSDLLRQQLHNYRRDGNDAAGALTVIKQR